MKTALVVSAGGFQGLGIVRALQRLDRTRVLVCDIHSEHLVRYVCGECFVAPPLADEQAFETFLLDLARHEHVDAIFPATAYELLTLARLRNPLVDLGVVVAVAGEELTTTLLDKLRTHHFLDNAGLPVPALLDPLAHDYAQPLFGRPREGWGGRGTVLLRSREEALAHQGDFAAHVWSTWLSDFEEYSADFAIDPHGHTSPVVLRRRLRTSGGFAVISTSVHDPHIAAIAQRTAAAIAAAGGCGIYNIQVVAPPDGIAFVSDVNPRTGTSATHALAEGINLPGFFMGACTTAAVPDLSARRAVKTVRVLEDVVVPLLHPAPRGIVFDLDDTLVKHKEWMLEKLQLIYADVFSAWVERSAFLLCAGQLIDEGERAFLIDRLLALLALPESLRTTAMDAYRAAIVAETPLFSDVEATLSALKTAGLPLAILTDNPPATQRVKIRQAPALGCIDAVVCSREHGGEKPAAAAFLQAAHALGVDPAQLVMIGDNYFRDGVGAIRAGYMHALIIRRNGTLLSSNEALAATVPGAISRRIDVVDSLLSARHACLSQ
ncbi:HAD-IA family hydrolase [Rhodanobacter sp. 7MK24]|uniref:HAD-IA family hydrolase n=1 Tax=Rhodanobacter sp. 7MK24 TaxID=2775922 RepID=UPI00178210B7|nr:HAD-IA family hydrolase [Rhodanobacter sp. 7MK24]MBD8881294.1 HAD-IA family hydrolase [Rhodanobacter sp. 7MK24]